MNRIPDILILILLYVLCSSRTCTEEDNVKQANEEKLLAASRDSIRTAFQIGQLRDVHLEAYEETAKQKLSDFADYLKIASDTSLDPVFREQASEMIRRIFDSGESEITRWSSGYPQNDISTLNQLLEKGLSQGMPVWAQPNQIKVLKSLTEVNDSTYSGRLSFYQNWIPFDIRKPPVQISELREVDVHVRKRVKAFGDESLTIWEVCLGNFH